MTITISTFRTRTSVTPAHATFESLQAFAASLPHTPTTNKQAEALWCPAEFAPGTTRDDKNVTRINLAVLDIDGEDQEYVDTVLETIEGLGLAAWIHSTHSHGSTAKQAHGKKRGVWCLRVVFPISRPIPGDVFKAEFWPRLHALFPRIDRSCKNASRLYFVPSCPPEPWDPEFPPIHEWIDGYPLDVDALLSEPLDDARAASGPLEDRTRKAPKVEPAPAPGEITPEIRAYCLRQLETACEAIRTAPFPGPIHETINTWAFRVGAYTPHILPTAEVRARLHEAHRARTADPELVAKNDGKVETALTAGADRPWTPIPWGDLDDHGLAVRLIRDHGAAIRYVPQWEKWLEFDGVRWRTDRCQADVGRAVQALRDALREEAEQVPDGRAKALRAAVTRLGSHGAIESLTKRASRLDACHVAIDVLNADHERAATDNGAIDLVTGELIDADPAAYDTQILGVPYDRHAACPRWERFVLEVCQGDAALVDYLHRAIGYSLQGTTVEQVLFFLFGDGANGKSVFLDVLEHVFGKYARRMKRELLVEKRGGGTEHPTSIAALCGARLAITSELNEGTHWDEALLKSLTGSERIEARRMREDPWEFEPTHKIWVSGNYRPGLRGSDAGIWRRMILIPFTSHVANPDPDLARKLKAEAPGILAWCVRGCLAWRRRGLKVDVPAVILDAIEEYKRESDIVGQFLDESYTVTGDRTDRVQRATMIASWHAWCQRNGHHAWSAKALFERVRRRPGVGESKHDGIRQWCGIRPRSTVTTFAGVN